jgi:hypothetical protein
LIEFFVRLAADECASQEAFPLLFRFIVLLKHCVNPGFREASLFFFVVDAIIDFLSGFASVDAVL